MKQRIFSGIRATGRLHLGNYLGAIKGMLELQENPDYEMLFSVVDVHAITTPYDKDTLAQKTREVVLDYLAAGMDPEKSSLVIQSRVADLHAELAFYFSTVVTVARMQHLPTYKDKVKQHPDGVTMALLNYPVLMAADILIYKSGLVPVGLDQEPHLEVAREIARKMNDTYGTDFPEPKRFATSGEYVPSLTGAGKMSKTVEGSYINLTDSQDEIHEKLKKVPTDSGKGVVQNSNLKSQNDKSKAKTYESDGQESNGVKSLMELVDLFMGEERRRELEAGYTGEGIRYGDLKNELAEAIYKELEPLQQRRKQLEADSQYVDRVIEEGAVKAREVARETVEEVKEKMGLY